MNALRSLFLKVFYSDVKLDRDFLLPEKSKLRNMLSVPDAETLVHAFMNSRLL